MNTAYTAKQLASFCGDVSPQGMAKQLARAGVAPTQHRAVYDGDRRVARDVPAWSFGSLPEPIVRRLREQGYPNALSLSAGLPRPWQPSLPEDGIADAEWQRAAQLRAVLLPSLREFADGVIRPADDRNARIAARFGNAFNYSIRPDTAGKLWQRTLDRDGGAHDWTRLAIYLPDHPRRKTPQDWTEQTSSLADLLPALDAQLATITSPVNPPAVVVRATWHVAFREFHRLVAEGADEARAARHVRNFLKERAAFLFPSRDALLKAWNEKLPRWLAREGMPGALLDLRVRNGRKTTVPGEDIARLRWCAAFKTSGRLNEAWREEYEQLTEATQKLGSKYGRCPRTVARAVNRVLLDGLVARRRGLRYLDKELGSITRNPESIPAMHTWVMDDMTANLEVFVRDPDGHVSLHLPQVIAVLDARSRKFVGWAASLDKGPTAELVCEAFLDAVKRTGKVPHHLCLENGWVFGRSHNVVGKTDEGGQVIVAGLAEYGCQVHHFLPQKPTAKGELEKAFDLVQRRMERHPGYTGREQRHDKPEQFGREQIAIQRKTNPLDPATCRYDFPQAVRAIGAMIEDYNATAQRGALKALSPNQAFEQFQDAENPPIYLPPQLLAMLAPGHYVVTVKLSGVNFSHYGRKIRVRGGQLANWIGQQLRAVVDRRQPDCVTFMTLDYGTVFTEPVCRDTDRHEAETAPDSGILADELRKRAAHGRAVNTEFDRLLRSHRDPREDLLREAQAHDVAASRQSAEDSTLDDVAASPESAGRFAPPDGLPARIPMMDPNLAAAAQAGIRQRGNLRAGRQQQRAGQDQARRYAERHGAPRNPAISSRPGFDDSLKRIFGTSKAQDKT